MKVDALALPHRIICHSMDTQLLLSNRTSPRLLFFPLCIVTHWVKSDLEIPPPTIKFISLHLLFAIGFLACASYFALPGAMRLTAPERILGCTYRSRWVRPSI